MPDKILLVACGRSVLGACTKAVRTGETPSLNDVVGNTLPIWKGIEPVLDLPRDQLALEVLDLLVGTPVLVDPHGFTLQPTPGAGPPQKIPRNGSRELTLPTLTTRQAVVETAEKTSESIVDKLVLFVQAPGRVLRYEAIGAPIPSTSGAPFHWRFNVAIALPTQQQPYGIVALLPGYLPLVQIKSLSPPPP